MKLTQTIRTLVAPVAILACSLNAFGWGQKGHDTTAYIAERHLTPPAKAAVDSLLDGASMVYWANWLDNASHTMDYAYTKTWHYINVDKGVDYDQAPRNPNGDVTTAIRSMISTLSSPNASQADKNLAMKILIHVTGDLHQPLHAGHASDLGGNKVKVKFFGSDKNLHSVWDTSLPESAHKWGFTEWAEIIDRLPADKQQAVLEGNIDDWAKQSIAIADEVYDYFPEGSKISYNQIARWSPTVEQQFERGGLRLAYILNLLFDPEYAAAAGKSASDL